MVPASRNPRRPRHVRPRQPGSSVSYRGATRETVRPDSSDSRRGGERRGRGRRGVALPEPAAVAPWCRGDSHSIRPPARPWRGHGSNACLRTTRSDDGRAIVGTMPLITNTRWLLFGRTLHISWQAQQHPHLRRRVRTLDGWAPKLRAKVDVIRSAAGGSGAS